MICAGIDAGSRATKVALFETEQGRLLGQGIADQEIEQERLAAELLERTCREAQVRRSSGMVRALEAALSCSVQVSPLPQYTGALGAALLAASRQSCL